VEIDKTAYDHNKKWIAVTPKVMGERDVREYIGREEELEIDQVNKQVLGY
jgi:hypothetical protein